MLHARQSTKKPFVSDSLLSLLCALPKLGELAGRLSPDRMGAVVVTYTDNKDTIQKRRHLTRGGLTSWCVSAPHIQTVVARRPFCMKQKQIRINFKFCHIINVAQCSKNTDSSPFSKPRSH